MKTSILIIAHNEEKHIRECIESILSQSQKADEIVLIAHNCTDNTVSIAGEYPEVTIYEFKTPEEGPLYARKYGFEKVHGDIIACIDGDSVADRQWLQYLIRPLVEDNSVVATGGRIWFYQNWRGDIAAFFFFLTGLFPLKYLFHFYFWGASFACRKSVYDTIGGFQSVEELPQKLGLHYSAEDCLLSFTLNQSGKVVFAPKSIIHAYPGTFFAQENRGKKQREDNIKMVQYFFGKK